MNQVNETVKLIKEVPNDVTIISGENDEIQTNKYLLSVFSPTLHSLLSVLCCNSPTILFPDCSTFSIKYLLNIITAGVTVTDRMSVEDVNEITETAQLLSIDMKELDCNEEDIKIFNNDVSVHVKSKTEANRPHKIHSPEPSFDAAVGDNNEESVFDVLDSLCKILDIDVSREDSTEEFTQSQDIPVVNVSHHKSDKRTIKRGIKRMRTGEGKNNEGKYSCESCDYQTGNRSHLNTHVEGVHEGVCYSCSHCGTKFSQKGSLKKHVEGVHEGVRYSCSHCGNKFTQKKDVKRHIESVHEGVCYTCTQCNYKATDKGHLKRHVESIHEGVRYPCDQCQYKARRKDHLREHKKSRHQ